MGGDDPPILIIAMGGFPTSQDASPISQDAKSRHLKGKRTSKCRPQWIFKRKSQIISSNINALCEIHMG